MSQDFKDGVLLIECLEKLIAPKPVGRYVKHPTNLAQKLDNIGKTLQLIKDQDIKLVNIGKTVSSCSGLVSRTYTLQHSR